MYKQRFTRITGHITGSRWVVTGDLKNKASTLAGRLWEDTEKDIRVKFDISRLENFSFSNVRASRNITDWMDVQKTDNIKLENKTTMWSTTSGTR